jgi:hypothetical protein
MGSLRVHLHAPVNKRGRGGSSKLCCRPLSMPPLKGCTDIDLPRSLCFSCGRTLRYRRGMDFDRWDCRGPKREPCLPIAARREYPPCEGVLSDNSLQGLQTFFSSCPALTSQGAAGPRALHVVYVLYCTRSMRGEIAPTSRAHKTTPFQSGAHVTAVTLPARYHTT